MDKDKTCATCRYYDPNPVEGGDGDQGRCRRNPPEVAHRSDAELACEAEYIGEWPLTRYDDWCGEHAPKDQEQGDAN